MNTHDSLKQAIGQLRTFSHTDPLTLDIMQKRLDDGRPLTRDEGESAHFCAMIVPIVRERGLVYVGHHIKSGLWISPGGHIDCGEPLAQTAVREAHEELGLTIEQGQLQLWDATVADISDRHTCTRHLDIWFLLEQSIPKKYQYEVREFYEAGWYPIQNVLQKAVRTHYARAYASLQKNAL